MKYSVTVEQAKGLFAAQQAIKNDDLASAVNIYEGLIREHPSLSLAYANLAVLCELNGGTAQAIQLYDKLLEMNPHDAHTHYNKALTLLTNGKLEEGWKEYKWRTLRESADQYVGCKFAAPVWNGEPLHGKKVVIWTEQGIGDEILLGTMLPDLFIEKGQFTIVCSPRMMQVFARTFKGIRVVNRDFVKSWTHVSYEYDYQISLSELGLFLRPNEKAFPTNHNGYLDWDAGASKEMRDRYKAGSDNLLVGIAWNSKNPRHEAKKTIPLEEWKNVLAVPNCTFVNLQYGDTSDIPADIISDPTVNPLENMDRYVAQVAALDLVISVSSTAVHVAGAIGMPVWNLVPHPTQVPLYYWGKTGDTTRWYPTMKLFRRDSNGVVLPRVEKALAELVAWST